MHDAATDKLARAFAFTKKVTWETSIDPKTGRPNFVADDCPGDPNASGNDDVTKGKSTFSAPGFRDGKHQMPMAYSPTTGLFYVPTNE